MKSTLKNLSIVVIAITISLTFSQCSNNDKILKEVATEINKTCPLVIDYTQTLDSCQALVDNNTLKYNYTVNTPLDRLHSAIARPSNGLSLIYYKYLLQTIHTESLRKNEEEDFKALKDNKTTFQYAFYDKQGKLLYETNVDSKLYNSTIKTNSDAYINVQMRQIVEEIKQDLPQVIFSFSKTPNQFLTDIKLDDPKHITYYIKNPIEVSASFDSISFQNIEARKVARELNYELFNKLYPNMGVSYTYKHFDKNDNYLATVQVKGMQIKTADDLRKLLPK